jgi:hypothetical protein
MIPHRSTQPDVPTTALSLAQQVTLASDEGLVQKPQMFKKRRHYLPGCDN